MPGAVSRTSTIALTNTTLNYGLAIAGKGLENAVKEDAGLALGVNCYAGKCTFPGVAEAFGLEYTDLHSLI